MKFILIGNVLVNLRYVVSIQREDDEITIAYAGLTHCETIQFNTEDEAIAEIAKVFQLLPLLDHP